MKILFVDDESKKLKRLYSAISQIEGINPEDLENVLDLKSAKEKLVSSFYDLVVMDLKISEYIAEYSEDESEIAGLEFIDEILGTDAIRTPQEIVILTEHDELQKKCTELGKDLEFQVLKYDEQSLEWENIIKSIPICLKSISDFADEKKGDGYQKYAAYTSAEFARYLIESVLPYINR